MNIDNSNGGASFGFAIIKGAFKSRAGLGGKMKS